MQSGESLVLNDDASEGPEHQAMLRSTVKRFREQRRSRPSSWGRSVRVDSRMEAAGTGLAAGCRPRSPAASYAGG